MAKPRPRVLIADNDARRRKAIRLKIGGRASLIEEADSAEAAGRALARCTKAYGYVFLDHDFGSASRSGIELAWLITLLPESRVPKEVLVHAESPIIADQMVRILEAAGVRARRVVV